MTTISPKALIRNLIETQYMDFDDVLVFNNPELYGTIENVSNWIVSYRWSDLLHVSVTSIRNAEKRGLPSYHPDCRKTIIHRRDILDYFCGGCGY
jgi:hypothetical protein